MQIVDYVTESVHYAEDDGRQEKLAEYTFKVVYQFPSLLGYWGAQIYDDNDNYLTRIDYGETSEYKNSLSMIAADVITEIERLAVDIFNAEQNNKDD